MGQTQAGAGPVKPKPPEEHRDAYREVVETIVFVVVLVLLLKTFVAEAFVIPTGSMAETLWGIQRVVECPECKYQFPVNFANQVSPQKGRPRQIVTGCTCPNCRLHISWNDVKDDWGNSIQVRDLTRGVFRFGRRPIDLYRRIYAGINGTPMPEHFGMAITENGEQRTLNEDDVWDLVFFVRAFSSQGGEPSSDGGAPAGSESQEEQH